MNYAVHYEKLITRARGRVITGYKERHHVLPRCMGGDDSPGNLIDLTPEEHFVAHQLLVCMYPKNISLIHAALLMAKGATGNKAFGWLRRRKAEAMRGNTLRLGMKLSKEHIEKMISSLRGKKRSPDAIERTAAAHRGKILSADTRAKIAAVHRGKPLSPEHRAKVSASLIGNKRTLGYKASPETRAKMSATRRGKPRGPMSDETRTKISIAKIGKSRSAESRLKQSLSTRGKPKAPEHKAKLAAHLRSISRASLTSGPWPL